MKHVAAAIALLVLAANVLADDPIPAKAPGWTGVTDPQDVIAARQALMFEMERLMKSIDSFTVGEPADPAALASAAVSISQMLLAVPHLFPPTTNLYDPAAETPATIALPAIWQDFSTFYALTGASAASAAALGSTTDPEALRRGGASLRATCDACHAPFLRAYVPASVSDEDVSFDFDSAFGDSEPAPKQ